MHSGHNSWQQWRERDAERRLLEAVKNSAATTYKFSIGIDLGKLRDNSVIACVQTTKTKDAETHALRSLVVMKLGLDYARQLAGILTYLDKAQFSYWPTEIFCDVTGLGEVCGDLLAAKGVKFKRCSITSGSGRASYGKGRWHLPRAYLIALLIKYLGREDFKISSDLTHAERLRKELQGLRVEYSKGGAAYVPDAHDDCLIALSLALHGIERRSKGPRTGVCTLFGDAATDHPSTH